jgi:hypothetical protein
LDFAPYFANLASAQSLSAFLLHFLRTAACAGFNLIFVLPVFLPSKRPSDKPEANAGPGLVVTRGGHPPWHNLHTLRYPPGFLTQQRPKANKNVLIRPTTARSSIFLPQLTLCMYHAKATAPTTSHQEGLRHDKKTQQTKIIRPDTPSCVLFEESTFASPVRDCLLCRWFAAPMVFI